MKLVVFSVMIFLILPLVFADQAMRLPGINHETKECSDFFGGDECATCTIPEGWEDRGIEDCPEGYAQVFEESDCDYSSKLRCCMPNHTGVNGDCKRYYLTPIVVVLAIVLLIWLFKRKKK